MRQPQHLQTQAIVAAVLVSSSGGGDSTWDEPPAFDEVVWCEAANAISRWSSILDGSATGDSLTDVQNLRQALGNARPVAPQDLTFEIARLQDLTLLVEQATEREGDLATGFAEAQQNVDRERVAQAVETVAIEIAMKNTRASIASPVVHPSKREMLWGSAFP